PGLDVVPMLSTRPRWFPCGRLSDPHLTRSRRAFSETLTTGALDPSRSRWFGACLRRPAPRGLPSSRTDIAWRTVVRQPDQERAPLEARLDLPLEPFVQHIVQEDVRKHRADHPALRRAGLGMRDASVLQHARVEPFADQSKQHPVAHPTLEQCPQMAVV